MTSVDDGLNFRTKLITFGGKNVRILLQRQHGPCPLLALTNCLLLREELTIPNEMDIVEDEYLISLLRQFLKEKQMNNINEQRQQQFIECIKALPHLLHGLDVNLSFGNIEHFEETVEYSSFQLMNVRLLHGWLVDPEDIDLYQVVSKLTYDEATSLATQAPNIMVVTENDLNAMETHEHDGYLCRLWIESTGHVQMTEHGLSKLYTSLKDNEVVAFYRNHHFFTLTKYDHSLFLLINEDALGECHDVVWESMLEVDHRGEYHDSFFNPLSNAAKKRVKRARLVEQQRQLLLQYELAHKRKLSSPKNKTNHHNDSNNNAAINNESNTTLNSSINDFSDNQDFVKSDSDISNVEEHKHNLSPDESITTLNSHDVNKHKRTSSNNSNSNLHNEIIIEDINPQLKSSTSTSSQTHHNVNSTPIENNRNRSIIAKLSPQVVFNDDDNTRELALDLPSMDDDNLRIDETKYNQHNDNSGTDIGLLQEKTTFESRDILLDDMRNHIMKNHRESFGPSVALQRHRINFNKETGSTQRCHLDRTLSCLLLLLLIFISLIIYAIVSFNT